MTGRRPIWTWAIMSAHRRVARKSDNVHRGAIYSQVIEKERKGAIWAAPCR